MTPLAHADVTEKIIGAAHIVHNGLGTGFLEKVYENALVIELKRSGLEVAQQLPIGVKYRDELVGEYIADLVVGGKVVVEVKSVGSLQDIHEVQLVNYLRATGITVGLLINFGRRVKVVRRILNA